MPKLNKQTAGKVEASEALDFSPLEEGIYEVQLNKVEVKEGKDNPYWSWEFEIPADAQENAGRRFWANTSLSEKALWKLKEAFAAFGASTDTDTEDLVGKRIRLSVSQTTIQKGPKTGELTNSVESFLPLDPSGTVTGAGKAGEDPLF